MASVCFKKHTLESPKWLPQSINNYWSGFVNIQLVFANVVSKVVASDLICRQLCRCFASPTSMYWIHWLVSWPPRTSPQSSQNPKPPQLTHCRLNNCSCPTPMIRATRKLVNLTNWSILIVQIFLCSFPEFLLENSLFPSEIITFAVPTKTWRLDVCGRFIVLRSWQP